MRKIIQSEWFLLAGIFLLGAFLRFWQIGAWQYLNFDQARDYLVVKRIVIDHKLTLLGPTVLLPGIYLPPFYYYSLVFPLLLSGFHAIGPDIYTAVLGTLAIGIFYFLAKDLFGKVPALITSLFFALNPYLIHASRHAWNPNTVYLFTLFFALCFERYWLKRDWRYLGGAAFSLGWALNLHYPAVVFLPLFIILLIKSFQRGEKRAALFSVFIFSFFFSPLLVFEVRHNFTISKAIWAFISGHLGKTESLSVKFFHFLADPMKLPGIFLSGAHQEVNLTIDPTHLSLFDEINLFKNISFFEKLKEAIYLAIYAFSFLSLFSFGWKNKRKESFLIVVFLFFGFAIRLIFPSSSLFFYHYTYLFPFLFLPIGCFIFYLTTQKKLVWKLAILSFVFLAILPLLPEGLKGKIKKENYYLSASKVIAQNIQPGEKIAIAVNVYPFHWYRHGPEYRYFLETFYHLPMGDNTVEDFQSADVLFLVDEGNLTNPLDFGGVEMESFAPKKVAESWVAPEGQKIYKLLRK